MEKQLSNDIIEALEKDLKPIEYTNLKLLQEYDDSKDYISYFCSLNDGDDSQLADRYYERYKLYATDEIKKKHNMTEIMGTLVNEKRKRNIAT